MGINTKPKFVIDSSALMAHLLNEPYNQPSIADAIQVFYLNQAVLYSPLLLPFEVGNVLKSCLTSKRHTAKEITQIHTHYLKLPIKYVPVDFRTVLNTSTSLNLSYYDASYLTLAKKLKCPLLTLDQKLLKLTQKN